MYGADSTLDFTPILPCHLLVIDIDLAFAWVGHPVNHSQHGGLTSARRAEQNTEFATLHFQAYIFHGMDMALACAKGLTDVFYFQHAMIS